MTVLGSDLLVGSIANCFWSPIVKKLGVTKQLDIKPRFFCLELLFVGLETLLQNTANGILAETKLQRLLALR